MCLMYSLSLNSFFLHDLIFWSTLSSGNITYIAKTHNVRWVGKQGWIWES